ncbi:sterol desaturase family protein [Nannocystis sp.]|uniref:sterol desaturase family protein n=1 Tax=Nannocystis sp. TaxID=1962667 RepID=UPI0025D171F9|nr:sterol desaturase family protein [Nannocystis sp.]
MTAALWTAVASLTVLVLVFTPLERVFPARPGQPALRPEWTIDLAFFLGQYLVFGVLVVAALHAVHAAILPLSLDAWSGGLPLSAQVVVALVLGDLLTYWFHRACHRYAWLWRFHAVHHSSERLDWLAAHREHPVDGVITQICINLPGMLLGLPFAAIGGLIVFRGLWAIFIHSNVRVPLGPLRVLLGASSCTTGTTPGPPARATTSPTSPLPRPAVWHLPPPARARDLSLGLAEPLATQIPRAAAAAISRALMEYPRFPASPRRDPCPPGEAAPARLCGGRRMV